MRAPWARTLTRPRRHAWNEPAREWAHAPPSVRAGVTPDARSSAHLRAGRGRALFARSPRRIRDRTLLRAPAYGQRADACRSRATP
eukprot:22021-Pleurochrysis_carterae.AAC.2